MRSIIIGLSVIFFSLSAFITYRAFNFPDYTTSYLNDHPGIVFLPPPEPPQPVAPAPVPAEILKPSTSDPMTGKAFVEDKQEVITKFETKPAITEEVTASTAVTSEVIQPRTLTVFGGKTFRSGQDVIQDVAYSTIENLVLEIAALPNSRLLIEGHTDNVPTGKSGSDNMNLSIRRAKAIANILVLHGIPKDRISVTGYGDTRPITSNNTEEGRAKNRRVEVKLLPQEGAN